MTLTDAERLRAASAIARDLHRALRSVEGAFAAASFGEPHARRREAEGLALVDAALQDLEAVLDGDAAAAARARMRAARRGGSA